MEIIKKYGQLVAIGVLSVLLLISTCNKPKDSYRDLYNQTFELKKQGDSVIAVQSQLLVEKNDKIVKDAEKIANLKNLKSQVIYKTKIVYRDSLIPFKEPVTNIVVIDSITKDTSNYIKVPIAVEKIDSFFYISGTVDTNGLKLDSIKIPEFETRVDIGDEKGLFKKQSVVRLTFNNPYVEVTKLNNIVVDDKSAKKQWKAFGIGTGVGFATMLLISLTSFLK